MTLQEQWQQDVERFGDGAYLMWEGYAGTIDGYDCWQDINNNDYWNYPTDIRRKDSAALPFDLERAKAGDTVEAFLDGMNWLDLDAALDIVWKRNDLFEFNKPYVTKGNFANSFLGCHEIIDIFSLERLRMKYPPTKQEQ